MSNPEEPKRPNGRPLKYATPELLDKACNDYFAKCDVNEDPYLVSGLCLHIDLDQSTLWEYGTREKFSMTVKKAKLRIQNYLERSTLGEKNPTGAIFNLKCNFGFSEKNTVDINLGGELETTNKNEIEHSLADDERDLLKEVAKQMAAKNKE